MCTLKYKGDLLMVHTVPFSWKLIMTSDGWFKIFNFHYTYGWKWNCAIPSEHLCLYWIFKELSKLLSCHYMELNSSVRLKILAVAWVWEKKKKKKKKLKPEQDSSGERQQGHTKLRKRYAFQETAQMPIWAAFNLGSMMNSYVWEKVLVSASKRYKLIF